MKITWYGHSCFRMEAAGAVVIVDPFLSHNPAFGGDLATAAAGATHIVLTHGHSDHAGDVLDLVKAGGPVLFANFEICEWLAGKGADASRLQFMNTGGTASAGTVSVTLVRADHSSSQDGVPLGSANGAILRIGDAPAVWHLGDTDIFSDMALICELHEPRIALVPVGDRFTMGGRAAAIAVQRFMPGVTDVLPCHYATFGALAPDADAFTAGLKGWTGRVHVPKVADAVEF